MTPNELREWYYVARDILQDALPGRDARLWSILWTVSVGVVAVATSDPDVFPPGWADRILHASGIVGLIAGKMGWSWAGSPRSEP